MTMFSIWRKLKPAITGTWRRSQSATLSAPMRRRLAVRREEAAPAARHRCGLANGDRRSGSFDQVVINLISNAVKFTDAGSITCSVICAAKRLLSA